MLFIADLHIHSRFSRATSKQLHAPLLAAWAAVKGVTVLGTGDFTHPVWRAELREALTLDEASGLYRLKDPTQAARLLPQFASFAGRLPQPFFMLQAEISNIYKRGGQVRKVHNLVYMPDFDAAERLCGRLEQIGNLSSDGRPILGLDSRHLLEMVLETDSRAALIPAHIWTPWFSLFGSKSGFDRIEDCYGDLTGEIFALETGLSSDPAMNRLWSALDRFRMVSNSDAHSGEKLGRETNRFVGMPSYDGIFHALRKRPASCEFAGTLEFYPQEGKYHLDGHRDCNIALEPHESLKLKNICPVCGKPLTVGVLHRVLALADRDTPAQLDEPDFASLIPLPEVLNELLGVGVKSRKLAERYAALLERFGPELQILHTTPISELRRYWDLFGEAIERMRSGKVIIQGGYDGEYGVIRVFDADERRAFADSGKHRAVLLDVKPSAKKGRAFPRLLGQGVDSPPMGSLSPQNENMLSEQAAEGVAPLVEDLGKTGLLQEQAGPPLLRFSPEQRAAFEIWPHPVLVLAGPGAGKTRVLIGRLAYLLHQGVRASQIVALTFTRRAASELEERLRHALGSDIRMPTADTLHALAYSMWHKLSTQPPMLLSEDAALRLFRAVNPDVPARRLRKDWERLSLARERLQPCPEDVLPARERYNDAKAELGLADYTDLLEFWLARLEDGASRPWRHVLVDEVQDLSPLQWALIRALLPLDGQGFFGIGDPDQSIYAFRGAQPELLAVLRAVWPEMTLFRLERSYRSVPDVLAFANAILNQKEGCNPLRAGRDG
ncbi:MAG: UvrD-helicase domain-containing protein, partial [Betaproteobacteria bacterium]|nr:UvrD-helicase domain-containing protein [Betaproteobacteria bacterium]